MARAGVHSESLGLAVTSREEAIKRNEQLAREGIAAEYRVGKDGDLMPLQFRDRNGRKEAHKSFGVFDRDAGYSDHAGR